MSNLETNDIQGIILRSYGLRPSAQFFFLKIENVQKARKWIGEIRHKVTHGTFRTKEERDNDQGEDYLNIAFSNNGLEKLGLNHVIIKDTHNPSFGVGPLNSHTTRMLGDTYNNAPENWIWGGPNSKTKDGDIHILLMVYAVNKSKLEGSCNQLMADFGKSGLLIVESFDTHLNKDGKEHFGYVDGISQPTIEGSEGWSKASFPENTVKAGEFVLGYPNEYSRFAESPKISIEDDPKGILRTSPADKDDKTKKRKDLGFNGSYLVFRQLSEDVEKFWKYVKEHTEKNQYGPGSKGVEYVAAKMFGRWTNGSPINLHPDKPKEGVDKENEFFYWKDDKQGHKCPIGSHVRRANPRDDFEQNPKKTDDENRLDSTSFSKKHRIIRRARPYGKPIAESMEVNDMLKAIEKGDTDGERGIYFIVVNADYGRQFEFVQQTWIASPKFRNLFSDPDPLMGSQENENAKTESFFTIQDTPVRQRMRDLTSFVTTKGSAYFFMPGIHALEYIAEGY